MKNKNYLTGQGAEMKIRNVLCVLLCSLLSNVFLCVDGLPDQFMEVQSPVRQVSKTGLSSFPSQDSIASELCDYDQVVPSMHRAHPISPIKRVYCLRCFVQGRDMSSPCDHSASPVEGAATPVSFHPISPLKKYDSVTAVVRRHSVRSARDDYQQNKSRMLRAVVVFRACPVKRNAHSGH